MYRDKKITVFIPCHNEEKGIDRVIKMVPDFVDEVFVIDNASTDGTVEKARGSGARVVRNLSNLGYGGSYIKGLPVVEGDIIVTTDGDGTYPIWKIKEMLDYFIDNDLDFISGARFPLKDKYSMRKRNRFGNYVLTKIVNTFYGLKLKDGQSGMWMFKKDILPLMKLKGTGMEFSNEIKIEAFKNKDIKAEEYHIDYAERIGTSKLYPVVDGIKMLGFLVKKKYFMK
ncbi:MAG: glycosyltransferase family 2 protein [Armatimonadota bacterium]